MSYIRLFWTCREELQLNFLMPTKRVQSSKKDESPAKCQLLCLGQVHHLLRALLML